MTTVEISPGRLPDGARAYRRTEMFTETSLPPALRKDHATKENVWGLIHLVAGKLDYRITDPRRDQTATVLTTGGAPGIVEPTILHHVQPLGPVRFYVEFYRL